MIIDSTAITPDLARKINNLVGNPFSLLARLRMGGIGSHRMCVKGYSSGFENLLQRNSNLLYSNVELRPKGIIVHISQRNHRFSWVLPYYQLAVFQSEGFILHGNVEFILFHTDVYFDKNKVFFARMFKVKEGNP